MDHVLQRYYEDLSDFNQSNFNTSVSVEKSDLVIYCVFPLMFNWGRWMSSNSKLLVPTVKCKIVTTSPNSHCDTRFLNLLAVRNDWQGDIFGPLWTAVMLGDQSSMTAQAWPLDLQDITGASEHVSIAGWIPGVCLVMWGGQSTWSSGWCGGWLEEEVSLGDTQRSSGTGGY